jgi:excisionase family DNA binding protein
VSTGPKNRSTPPRLAFRLEEAAATLGVSHDYFAKNIAPELRVVRHGRVRLVPRSELERWLDANAAYAIDTQPHMPMSLAVGALLQQAVSDAGPNGRIKMELVR